MANPDIRNYGQATQFKPGQSGNPHGRPKGSRSFKTMVRQLVHDKNLADKMLKNKPSYWDDLPEKSLAAAVAVSMCIKAMNGDVKAAAWLSKIYGSMPEPPQPRRTEPVKIFDLRRDEEFVMVPKSQIKS